MSKFTAIYVRRSVSDKDKGNNSLSIDAQREECIRYVGEVHGHMGLNPMVVGEFHRLRKLLRGEVASKGPHTKVGAGQINGIRAVKDGHFQPFHVPGRGQ